MARVDEGLKADPSGHPGDVGSHASESALLLHYLKTHDAVCPLCKYNLRALTVPRCPECGREITLTIGLTEPYLRFFIVTLVALGLALGSGIICLVMCLDEGLPRVHETIGVLFVVYGSLASILPAVICLIFARRLLRLSTSVQLILAIAAVVWDFALLWSFMAVIFRWFR